MKPVYFHLVGSILIISVSATTYYLLQPRTGDNNPAVLPPAPIQAVLESNQISIAGSQPTTLRWIAASEEFVSVNLKATSYGLGLMTKERYDNLETNLLAVTTPEPANNASSTLAAQTGFRVAGHACIVGYTFAEGEPAFERPQDEREVYSIIVCSDT